MIIQYKVEHCVGVRTIKLQVSLHVAGGPGLAVWQESWAARCRELPPLLELSSTSDREYQAAVLERLVGNPLHVLLL